MTHNIIFPNLRAELARKKLLIQDIAVVLGLTRDSVGAKLSGKGKLYLDEAFHIRNNFFSELELDYLFALETINNHHQDTG